MGGSRDMVDRRGLRQALRELQLSGAPVCVHSSLSSFGYVDGGPDSIIGAFLDEGCTIVVPSFTHWFGVASGEAEGLLYDASMDDCVDSMGALPRAVLAKEGRARGRHPLNSFSAVGPLASHIISRQTPDDVYGPLKAICELGGYAVLMGVDYRRLTLLHLAEAVFGRELLRRWARDSDGQLRAFQVGSCSDGFNNFASVLDPMSSTMTVGSSEWRVLRAQEAVSVAAIALADDQYLTHCGDASCPLCRDATSGGRPSAKIAI